MIHCAPQSTLGTTVKPTKTILQRSGLPAHHNLEQPFDNTHKMAEEEKVPQHEMNFHIADESESVVHSDLNKNKNAAGGSIQSEFSHPSQTSNRSNKSNQSITSHASNLSTLSEKIHEATRRAEEKALKMSGERKLPRPGNDVLITNDIQEHLSSFNDDKENASGGSVQSDSSHRSLRSNKSIASNRSTRSNLSWSGKIQDAARRGEEHALASSQKRGDRSSKPTIVESNGNSLQESKENGGEAHHYKSKRTSDGSGERDDCDSSVDSFLRCVEESVHRHPLPNRFRLSLQTIESQKQLVDGIRQHSDSGIDNSHEALKTDVSKFDNRQRQMEIDALKLKIKDLTFINRSNSSTSGLQASETKERKSSFKSIDKNKKTNGRSKKVEISWAADDRHSEQSDVYCGEDTSESRGSQMVSFSSKQLANPDFVLSSPELFEYTHRSSDCGQSNTSVSSTGTHSISTLHSKSTAGSRYNDKSYLALTSITKFNQGIMYAQRFQSRRKSIRNLEKARTKLRSALKARILLNEDANHPSVAPVHEMLGHVERNLGEVERSEMHYWAALEICQRQLISFDKSDFQKSSLFADLGIEDHLKGGNSMSGDEDEEEDRRNSLLQNMDRILKAVESLHEEMGLDVNLEDVKFSKESRLGNEVMSSSIFEQVRNSKRLSDLDNIDEDVDGNPPKRLTEQNRQKSLRLSCMKIISMEENESHHRSLSKPQLKDFTQIRGNRESEFSLEADAPCQSSNHLESNTSYDENEIPEIGDDEGPSGDGDTFKSIFGSVLRRCVCSKKLFLSS